MNIFKECRERKGFTQKEIAIELKVSVQAISYWENGERMPSYSNLVRLAELYEVSIDTLLGKTDPTSTATSHVDPGQELHFSKLSLDERELLCAYNKLTANNKKTIISNINFLLDNQDKEKETRPSAG